MESLKFEELQISREMKKAIKDMGFEEASPIQSQAIPEILKGKDVIGQSQTGTGKTAAFGIPTIEMVDDKEKKVCSIVLCPTRELAIQVAEELRKLAKYKRGLVIVPIYGGQPIDRQIKLLKKGVHIVIGTPGRVKDHINRGTIKLDKVKSVVLDEADEMLDMGFREDIEFILNRISKERQTILFSATMPKQILDITKKFQRNPVYLKAVHKELTVPLIEQYYIEVREHQKSEVLSRLIDKYNPRLSLVFANTKRKVDEVVANLQARGYLADGLHGDMNQSQRDTVMAKFRKGVVEILVATDVAARGIDVDDVDAVFNYDVPQDVEYYVHRIGRTGRAGRDGKAFTFVSGREFYRLRDIQVYAKAKIVLHKIPTLFDIEKAKTNKLFDDIKSTIEEGELGTYISMAERLIEEDYSAIDVAAAVIKLYAGNEKKNDMFGESELQDTGAKDGMVRLFVNIGRSHNIGPKDIVSSIATEVGIPGKIVGSIRIFDKFTFVEVPEDYAKEVLLIMKNREIKGNRINIEPAKKK